MDDVADLYLNLLARVLTRELDSAESASPGGQATSDLRQRLSEHPYRTLRDAAYRRLQMALRLGAVRKFGNRASPVTVDQARALVRLGDADTMIGMPRLRNLQECIREIVRDDVPGHLIETGVWRGGASIFMRGALAAYGDEKRDVWLADSFQGLPPPDSRYPADRELDFSGIDYFAVSSDEVRERFSKYNLLDSRVHFLEGWFADTLASAPVDEFSLIRLDGDLYQSTLEGLEALYPRLSPRGFLIVDDYGSFPACKQAVTDYRDAHGIVEPIVDIDGQGIYWQRSP
jgi:O-methyltransferase